MKQWWSRSRPDELQAVPWLAPEVVEFLSGLLSADMRVIEHGSGGSTLWFAERVRSVEAVEANETWLSKVNEHVPKNVTLILDDIPPATKRKFDLLLIDGEPVATRREWLEAAPKLVKPGGWVVLDNANRPEYARERALFAERASLVRRFDANQPGTLYLVTEFYKLPGGRREKK